MDSTRELERVPVMRFGPWVRARRRERDLTQEALAALSGVNQGKISDIERGLDVIDRDVVRAIGAALGDEAGAIAVWMPAPVSVPTLPHDEDEKAIVEALRSLRPGDRKMAIKLVRTFAER